MTNPALTEMTARARVEDLRRSAARRSAHTGRLATRRLAARRAQSRRPARWETVCIHLAPPRQAIGRFLISLGLRLAAPRSGSPAR
jgi:hypothetical protein